MGCLCLCDCVRLHNFAVTDTVTQSHTVSHTVPNSHTHRHTDTRIVEDVRDPRIRRGIPGAPVLAATALCCTSPKARSPAGRPRRAKSRRCRDACLDACEKPGISGFLSVVITFEPLAFHLSKNDRVFVHECVFGDTVTDNPQSRDCCVRQCDCH